MHYFNGKGIKDPSTLLTQYRYVTGSTVELSSPLEHEARTPENSQLPLFFQADQTTTNRCWSVRHVQGVGEYLSGEFQDDEGVARWAIHLLILDEAARRL
jgi:hypothetical protein